MAELPANFRQWIFTRAEHRCEYCQTARRLIGMPLVIDHILPRTKGGTDEQDNLCAACYRCNEFKGDRTFGHDPIANELIQLYNPRTDKWHEHFRWENGGVYIVGQTSMGRATVLALRLNNEYVVESRALWSLQGWHPPTT